MEPNGLNPAGRVGIGYARSVSTLAIFSFCCSHSDGQVSVFCQSGWLLVVVIAIMHNSHRNEKLRKKPQGGSVAFSPPGTVRSLVTVMLTVLTLL